MSVMWLALGRFFDWQGDRGGEQKENKEEKADAKSKRDRVREN